MCDNAYQLGREIEALSHRVFDLETKPDHHIGGCPECAAAIEEITPALAEDVMDHLAETAEEVVEVLEEVAAELEAGAEAAEEAGEEEAAEAAVEAAEEIEEAAEVVEEAAEAVEEAEEESEKIAPARTHFLTRPIGKRNTV